MKRVLVTGGAGFLGSHLCDYLLGKGYEVICMDNLITGSTKNIAHLEKNSHFSFVRHNVCERIEIDGALDYVLHFASPASPIDYQKIPIQTLKVGSLGTHNTLGLALAKKAMYMLASTSEVYGDPLVNPQPESYWGNVNPVGVRGCYDEAKRFSEALVMAYHRIHKLDTRIVRIFNTYGPRMRLDDGRVVPNLIGQALRGDALSVYGDGSQTRSFCHVSDLIEGIYRLMVSNINNPVNIGNPDEYTILEFAKIIQELIGTKSTITFEPLPQDDPRQRRPDITKAKKELGFESKVKLREGLTLTIEWFSSQNA